MLKWLFKRNQPPEKVKELEFMSDEEKLKFLNDFINEEKVSARINEAEDAVRKKYIKLYQHVQTFECWDSIYLNNDYSKKVSQTLELIDDYKTKLYEYQMIISEQEKEKL